MKPIVICIASLWLMLGCTNGNKETVHTCIAPLDDGISPEALNDCTVAVAFSASDFNWQEGSLRLTVYREHLYDAADISRLQVGDTIVYEGHALPVESIEAKDGFVVVNGGIEQGGAELTAHEGGTYRATTFNDHSVWQETGTTRVPLAADFVLTDCGENPTDIGDTIREGQKAYIDRLPDYRQDFYPTNTKVRIENGMLKAVNRRWIP